MVLSARVLNFTVTNRSISGTHMRRVLRFGTKSRGVFAVTCWPTPPFFLAIPRRWMMCPLLGFAPVMLQTLDIEPLFRKERKDAVLGLGRQVKRGARIENLGGRRSSGRPSIVNR